MSGWNGVDFLFFLIFAVNTLLGMSRGATKEIISMMCLCVALIFTIKFTVPLSNFLNSSPSIVKVVESPIIQNFMLAIGAGPLTVELLHQIFYSISLLICFVSIFSICEGALTMSGFVEMYPFPYAAFNRKVGGTLGFTRGYVINLIFICIFTLHLFSGSRDSMFSNSFFVKLFHGSAVRLDSIISGQNPDQYQKIFEGKNLYNEEQLLKVMGAPSESVAPTPAPAQPSGQYQPFQVPQQQPQGQPQGQPQPQQSAPPPSVYMPPSAPAQ